MDETISDFGERSRLRLLLDRLSLIEDAHDAHRVAYPLAEIMLLSVCGTIANCDDYEARRRWGLERRHRQHRRRRLQRDHCSEYPRSGRRLPSRRLQRPASNASATSTKVMAA
jgi:hypothetical protein